MPSIEYVKGPSMMPPPAGDRPVQRASRIAVVSDALPGWSAEDVLRCLLASGAAAVEISVGPGCLVSAADPRAAVATAARFRDAGLHVCGLDAPADRALGAPGLDAVLELAVEVQAPFLRLYPPPFDPRMPVQLQMQALVQAVRAVQTSLSPEVSLLVEPAPGSVAPSLELACRALSPGAAMSGAGIVFDPGSLVSEGFVEPELAVALLGERLAHVHVKNRALAFVDGRRHSCPQRLFGAGGFVDWPATLAALRCGGYAGWLSIDHLSGLPTPGRLAADIADLRRMDRDGTVDAGG